MKKIFQIIIFITVLSTLVSGAYLFIRGRSTLSNNKVPNGTPKPSAVVSEVIVSAGPTENGLDVYLSPKDSEVKMAAFSLKLTIESPNEKFGSVTSFAPSVSLTKSKWSFPIKKSYLDSNDNLVIELSGFYLGENPFIISSQISLASVTFSKKFNVQNLNLKLSEDVTKFILPDGITNATYSVKENNSTNE